VFVYQHFLFRGAETDEKNMWIGSLNVVKHFLQAVGPSLKPERRAANSGDLDSGIAPFQNLTGKICRLWLAAQEEDTQVLRRPTFAQLLNQVDSRDARHARFTGRVTCPHDRHAIRTKVVCSMEALTKPSGFLR
jgi:hypothetical protein